MAQEMKVTKQAITPLIMTSEASYSSVSDVSTRFLSIKHRQKITPQLVRQRIEAQLVTSLISIKHQR